MSAGEDRNVDLFVIGGGSGGVRAARFAAGFGARVAIAEAGRFGGTCVNVGCIPKKLFSYAAHFRDDMHDAADFGWTVGETRFDWPTLIANKDREIARLNGVYERLLANAGVEILRGHARLADAHTVEVGGTRWQAKNILVATGSWPQMPSIPGAEHAISSNEAFALERLPQRAVVVGGGYIALEFASIFNGLGVETTLAYRGARLLRHFDAELGERIADELAKKGVRLRLNAAPLSITRSGNGTLEARFSEGPPVAADLVMFATGRVPNTHGLGLETAGVQCAADGRILVDRMLKSNIDSVYAIGDVANQHNLTPVATAEGMAVARTLFNNEPTPMDYENIATAVFCNPNLATVGLSEAAARKRFAAVDVYRTSFRALKHTLGETDERLFMKLVVDATSARVVGAHMIGPEAGEIIQGVAIAVRLGATKAQFDATIGIHPTSAEEFVTLREKAA
ncbi:MAG: glutathione reductase [Betaproteobacteria bacterium SG8_39]|nr:MAG: glutathione reductase [Betaproteobacteria bacterium SG8_39]